MSEPKLISPLLNNYIMGDPISEKTGVRCCPALERDLQTKCIVKIISTPTSQSQLDALLLSGAYSDAQSALQYFKSLAEGIVEEAKILQRLSQLEGFFPYINWQLVEMTDGVGFDVYTLSEYRKTLFKLLKGDNMTHLAAVNLGLDLCTALAVCRRIGHLYVNLKPENIYLSENNTWKIGDIGFVPLDSLKYASLPERYRSEYTAPEIADAFASLNTTLDVYALGLVLYRIYNGNQLPANLGNPDNAPLLPPDFADYEMSEIILKACDPDPAKRWQDPIEMGQALVSYMQRNGVNDTPIVPAPVASEQPPEPEIPEQSPADEVADIPADTDSFDNAEITLETPEAQNSEAEEDADEDILPVIDETAPEQNTDLLEDIAVTDEVSDILSQVDDLIAHPTPDMSTLETDEETDDTVSEEDTTADPLEPEVPVSAEDTTSGEDRADSSPEPTSDTEDEVYNEEAPDAADTADAPAPEDAPSEEDLPQEPETSTPETDTDDEESEQDEDEYDEDIDPNEDEPEHKPSHLLRNLLIATVVLLLAAIAFLFYTKYYIQTIDSLKVDNSTAGIVTVYVSTETDESLLTIVCSDAYGTPTTANIQNGTATFEGLVPGAAYTVNVQISGFHSLKGTTTAAFTTPNEINILQFHAVTGSEDGSVILTFTTKDQDAEVWTVSYADDSGAEIVEEFSGHMHTIQGLAIGKEYTFCLTPKTDIKFSGETQVTHTASAVVIPENVQITSIAEEKLTVTWSAPKDASAEAWSVHCYNDNGYTQVITVQDTVAVFESIDPANAYTVEVSAVGMSVSARASAPANAINVSNFKVVAEDSALVVTWDAQASSQWVLTYTVGNSPAKELNSENENRIVIEPVVPNATYTLQLSTQDCAEPLGGKLVYQSANAEKFSAYGVKASDMRFYSCRTPKKSDWSKKDLNASDYTSSFKVGENASFLAEVSGKYNPAKDSVTTMFVFRDQNGAVVDYSTATRTWKQMWYKGLCELDIPSLPSAPGQYSVTIYMNGKIAGESKITITD